MKKKKLILSLIFSLLVFLITFYIVFSKHSFNEIVDSLKILNNGCIVICLIIMVVYFILYGLYIKITFNSMNEECTLKKGVFYGAVEFLFNALTPGAAGGQPIAIYYMNKDKKPLNKSMIVSLLSTVLFKITLVIGGVLVLIFKPDLVFSTTKFIRICFFAGLTMDVFVATFYLLVMYWKSLIRLILNIVFKVWYKIRHIDEDYHDKTDNILKQYTSETKFVKTHKLTVALSVLIIFTLRLCLFSLVYFIYRGLGFNALSYFDMVLIQIFITIAVEPIFLPGGTGISEYVSHNVFEPLLLGSATSAMLLYRSLGFYIPIVIIAVIFMIITNIQKKTE